MNGRKFTGQELRRLVLALVFWMCRRAGCVWWVVGRMNE